MVRKRPIIYTTEDTLVEIIFRREGSLNHPERFNISKSVVDKLIDRCSKEYRGILSNTWISFFKRYGKLTRLTSDNIEVITSIRIPMFVRKPARIWPIRDRFRRDTILTRMFVESYTTWYGKEYPLPKWVPIDESVADSKEINIQELARQLVSRVDRSSVPTILWDIAKLPDFPVRYLPMDINTIERYIQSVIRNHLIVDDSFCDVYLSRAWNKDIGLWGDPDDWVEQIFSMVTANGNNLKIVNRFLRADDTLRPRFTSIDRLSLCAPHPVTDFSILLDYWQLIGVTTPNWTMIKMAYEDCDLRTIPDQYSNGLLDINNFQILLYRADGEKQIANLIRSNVNAISWIYANITSILPSQYIIIVEGLLDVLKSLDTSATGHIDGIYIRHRVLSTLSTIMRSNPDRWIESFPELLRYCDTIDNVTIDSAIRNASGNQKELFEAVPLRNITQTEIIRIISTHKGFLHLNRSKSVYSKETISLHKFIPSISLLLDLFFEKDNLEYIEDVDDPEVEQMLIDHLNVKKAGFLDFAKTWLSKHFRYILYRCK